ncbi:hypothetical protein TWF594_008706 [Orbilia oligospora]|uniref:PNPLA domain-containing protein n=1 Tax=Orbilia oligospora TaxID=2813651 RepID=A0A7C8JS06_ORBOL|nr:hypothetical protein TWF706_005673 [Orbilia oligospora]KAF3134465.1 hypothetical protein TWF594_008706 [Orbilia oligospora]KAF3134919.1 hypothetical protein TWF703_006250 [Orbilia oligospora]
MEKKELEALAMAYTDPPQYFLTPPHERDILNEMAFSSNRFSYMAPPAVNSPPLRLLSLDGGGVKGYSSLLLLQEVMYRLFVELNGRPPQMHEIPLPCDHFDMIAGVGTGGLIALMLGRLRMDVESCKEHWVKMAKRVFETDKTIAGIPFKTTVFKASKLETVIKEITKEYTAGENEDAKRQKMKALQHKKNFSMDSKDSTGRTRASSSSSGETAYSRRSDELRMLAGDDDSILHEKGMKFEYLTKLKSSSDGALVGPKAPGDAEALLYDPRDDRCKTFVAAMYQNSPEGASPCLLRTYLSLSSLNPEPNCKIWEAGRATSATMTAFKPIQIGQTVFLDEGAGRYNITPTVIEEATCNEWPGRAVGCVLSVGTGRPPPKKQSGSQPWWENKIHTPFDNFVDAKKRLVHKTHMSEEIHQMLLGGGTNGLEKWGVQKDDYFRLNVDMGVTDFAMNEWQRLSDISTSTKRWLNSPEGKKVIGDCAIKLAHIWRAKNIPPPKNPLRQQIPLVADPPIEPLVTRSRPVSLSTTDTTPRPPSRMRPRTQAHERQLSYTPTSTPPATISRARTITGPVRHNSQNLHEYSYHNPHHHHQKSLSLSSTYRDSYYTSEDESDEIKPRPLSVRQRSFTTSSASNSSSSIVIDGGVLGNGKDKRYSVLNTIPTTPVPPIPRRAMTEGRINISPTLNPIPNPNPPSPDE